MLKPLLTSVVLLLALVKPAFALPGDPDLTFGTGGKVLTDFGGYHQITCLALQKNGRILAAGASRDGGPWLLVRYLPDGKLDPSFGKGGVVATDFGDAFTWCTSMALDAQGRIVLAGKTGESLRRCDFAVARYLPDGALDESFADQGGLVTLFPKGFGAESVLIQKDGKIVVSGSAGTSSQAMTVMRHLPSGKIDRTFGAEGIVHLALSKSARGSIGSGTGKAALQPDGKFLVAGTNRKSLILARLNPDGTTDSTFSKDGILKTLPAFGINSLSVSSGGKILLADSASVTVYDRKGIRQNQVLYSPYGSQLFTGPNAAAVDSFGDFMIAASADPGQDQQSFSLARFTHEWSSDQGFGQHGESVTRFGNSYEVPFAMMIQPDGKILTAGVSAVFKGGASFALARHEGGRIRPDLIIGNGKKGDNIYQGYAYGEQWIPLPFRSKNAVHSVEILLQNDGTVKDTFKFKAYRTSRAFGFRCIVENQDISRDVMKGKYITPIIQPGKTLRIRVEITSREIDGITTEDFSFQAISRIRRASTDFVMIGAYGVP